MNFNMILGLWAAVGTQVLVDDVSHIPAAQWRYHSLTLKQTPVTVDCQFKVLSGNAGVRVALVNRDALDQIRQGDREPMESTPFRLEGSFQRLLTTPDEYAVVVENGGVGPVGLKLRVALEFSEQSLPKARYISPERRLAVIGISLTAFLVVVIYSARKLLAANR